MNIHFEEVVEKLQGTVAGTLSIFLLLTMTSATLARSQEDWICEETAYYSVYEDVSLTESKKLSNAKTLKWIDENTIGLESISLNRLSAKSETFFNQNTGSLLHINQTERPYIVVLTQPQVWMNKFGNLRIRFYRCTP